ncbi:hypothetical protein QL093DRAFT_2356019, partial [Fusarium oxysporum]
WVLHGSALAVLGLIEDDSPFGTRCVSQPLPGRHLWSADHTAPFVTPGDGSSMANDVYTATALLLDGFAYGYDAD